ncbi:MAG: 50S ribosomal protein L31, partial [bacterium]
RCLQKMKKDIHPKYVPAVVICACGYTFKTMSTKPEIRVDMCWRCHPVVSQLVKEGKEKDK